MLGALEEAVGTTRGLDVELFYHVVGGQGFPLREIAGCPVAGRKAFPGVGGCDLKRGPQSAVKRRHRGFIGLAGDIADQAAEKGWIGDLGRFPSAEGDALDVLGSQDGSEAAAAETPPAIRLDAGETNEVFSGRTDTESGGAGRRRPQNLPFGKMGFHTFESGRVLESDAGLVDMENGQSGGRSLKNDGVNAAALDFRSEGSPAIGFRKAARGRAFGEGGGSGMTPETRSSGRTDGQDEPVFRPEGIDAGGILPRQETGAQSLSTQDFDCEIGRQIFIEE